MDFCTNCVNEYAWRPTNNPFPKECKECEVIDGKPSKFKPKNKTNADRIRAMSDEALCERLYHIWRNEADKGNDIAINWCDPECCSSEECDPDKHKACILRWLQRPAEGCR